MMWSTFIVKRLSAAAFLVEKVSHAQTVYSMPVWLREGDVKSVRQYVKCLHFFFPGGEST